MIMKQAVAAGALAALAALAAAAQTPQVDAADLALAREVCRAQDVSAQARTPGQQNFKRCSDDAMADGLRIVTQYCGAAPNGPILPGYEPAWDKITGAEYQTHTQSYQSFAGEVSTYKTCIDRSVMGNGALETRTLDYAACAHQAVGERLCVSQFMWRRTCQAFGDTVGAAQAPRCDAGA